MHDFYIYGTDKRFDLIADRLIEDGKTVARSGVSQKSATYLFPLNTAGDALISQLENIQPKSLVFVGKSNEAVREKAKENQIHLISLLDEHDYVEENALATAEGTLASVIQETNRVLRDTCVLICGFGNCGKAIARLFWLCGCEVWIFSREGSMEKAHCEGFNTYRAPGKHMGMFDAIINTVPAPIFSETFLQSFVPGTHLFQVASGLSGIDPNLLKEKGIPFHPLPGLPGKVAPESEADSILRILSRYCSDSNQERQ